MFIIFALAQMLLVLFLVFFKILWKSGAWISVILAYVIDQLIVSKLMGIHMTKQNYPEIYPVYEKYLLMFLAVPIIVCCSIKIYKFIKKTIRKFKGEVDVIKQS